MKTILAHWKKDLIASRPILAAWSCCLAILFLCFLARFTPPLLSENSFNPGSYEFGTIFPLLYGALIGIAGAVAAQLVLLTLLTARIIHLDPLIEPDAFWRTRPISRGGLLAAKALYIILLLLGALFSIAAVHPDPASKFSSFLGTAVFLIGLVAFACVTSNLSQLILHWLALVIFATLSVGAIHAIGSAITSALHDTIPTHFSRHLSTASNPQSLIIPAIYLTGFLAAIFCQYFTLKTNLSRLILFLTLFSAFLAQS